MIRNRPTVRLNVVWKMIIRSEWRIGPSATERSAATTTAAMAAAAETMQSHLEFVLDERVGNLNADQRRFLDVAVRHGDRLVRLVEDMRTVALAESGELEAAWSRFDLVAVVQSVVERLWPVARVESKSLAVQHGGPVWVDADERRVVRALLGLLTDAVDLARPDTQVTLAVRESRVELAYEGDQPPSEIGLALAEAIAGLHGGDLSLRIDEGVVFLGMTLGRPLPAFAAA
jgi:signal transduction histidine kinase